MPELTSGRRLDQPRGQNRFRLNIDPDTPLEITTDGQTLVVSPARNSKHRAKFQASLKETNRRYGRALKRLAD